MREFLPLDAGAEFDDYLQRVLSAGKDEGVLRIRARDEGERRWRYGNRLSRVDADSGYVVGHAIDVTEQIEEADALRERSERDPLTGSWNRRIGSIERVTPPRRLSGVTSILDTSSVTDTTARGVTGADRVARSAERVRT